jgi:hypothetical protein
MAGHVLPDDFAKQQHETEVFPEYEHLKTVADALLLWAARSATSARPITLPK